MRLPLPKSIKPGKTWIVLGVALGVGLFAALAARTYIANRMEAIEARANGRTVNVVVAKHDLPKGGRVSADSVAVRPIPVDFAHTTAVLPEAFDRIDGEVLAYPVRGGEMILWGLLEGRKAPTFSARVAAGRRAMTVPVDEINSISGMLEPGDVIDLLVTIDQDGRKLTFPLLQHVQVMATGQRSSDVPAGGDRRQYTTVTLDTSPEEAQHIIVARETGRITALLRNPQDQARLATSGGDLAALLGRSAEDAGQLIPVLYGGQSGQIPPEGLRLGRHIGSDRSAPASVVPARAGAPALAPTTPPQVPVISGAALRP